MIIKQWTFFEDINIIRLIGDYKSWMNNLSLRYDLKVTTELLDNNQAGQCPMSNICIGFDAVLLII